MEVTVARLEAKDILFRRIGVDLPVSAESAPFQDAQAPVRGLAVSNRYGICFFTHPEGFVVTQTSSVVDVAQQAKDDASGKNAQRSCYLNVGVSGVRILCLSSDELTLAVCVGDRTVQIYDVPTLVHKLDSNPLESREIPEGRVKDFRWSPANDEIYAVLSREGRLYSGHVGEAPLCVVNNNVVAVSWSPDGKHVAYATNERAVCVCNSKFESQYNFELPTEVGDFTDNLQVESLDWVRPDSMLVAYIQTSEDGDEEECPLVLVTSSDGDLAKEGGTIAASFFDGNFPSIDSRVLSADSGPYMLAEYIQPWEMAITASRRSVDDHIVNLGWSSEKNKNGAFSIDIRDDTWLPRIELQVNGDDNILVGLAVGMTIDLQITDPRDDSGDTKLPACPVLMCLSLGGTLSLFSVARLDESTAAASLVSPPLKLPEREVKSKTSVGGVTKVPQSDSSNNETPTSQPAKIKEAEERVTDEQSISSGSEDDGNRNEEVLPRFPAPDSQRKNLAVKDGSSVSAKDTSSAASLETPGALALSSLASSGASNTSHLNSAKSAPSGLYQMQQTSPSAQSSALLTRTVTQVQSSSGQTSSLSQSTSFSSLSSAGLKFPQSSGTSLFGQAGNDKVSSAPFSQPFQGSSSSSLSSGGLKASQPSGFGFFGQAGNDKNTTSPTTPSFPSSTSASLSSGSLKPQQPSGFGFGSQASNEKGTGNQFTSSFQGATPASQPFGNLRSQQSSGLGFGNQPGNDKGTRAPILTQKPSPLERGSQTGPQKLTASGARTLAMPSARQSSASEPEQAFIVELEKIKKMADEVDNLMAFIEGRGQRNSSNQPPCFTKQSVNELELGIRSLADNCKTVKERVEEERQSLNNLRDENLQVDAWRLYVQSLAEQAAENRHQELWSRRKLTPDLDVKRKRVTKAEQALKQQIAALEEHVHHLELDNRKRVVSLKGGKNNLNRQASTGRSQSIQNLYSTVNGLLSSADRLSQQVSQQMEALNISTQPQIAQRILKSVGLPSEDTVHVQSRPTFSGTSATPLVRQQSVHSPSLKTELGLPVHSTPPRRTMPSDSGVGAPSITRRRRDSMDGVQKALALAGGASPKTTIERVSHHTPSQQPNSSSTSSNMFVKHIRQRSFQESSEESSSHPRHVRRVLSSQTRSATSSPVSSPEIKSSSATTGFSANSAVTSLQGSQPSTVFEQQSGDSRPDSKRAASRIASSFPEKSGPTMASRFGPLPGRTTTPSTSSSTGGGSPFGSLPSTPPSESVFKFANSNPPNAVSYFSFAPPTVAKPTGTVVSSGSMSFGKPASYMGTSQSSSTGGTASLPSFPTAGFNPPVSNPTTGSMPTAKLGTVSTKPGADKSSVESGKDDKPTFGFKAASPGISSFGTLSFASGSFSKSTLSGSTQAATTQSSTSFSLSIPANKAPGVQEGDAATKQNDMKPAVPPTSLSTQNIWGEQKSTLSKPTSAPAATTVPISVAPPPALFGAQVSAVPTPTNVPESKSSLSSLNVPASSPTVKSSSSPLGSMFAPTSLPTNAAPSSSESTFVFPAASTPAATFSVPPIKTPDSDEEDMDEEQVPGETTTSLGGFSLGGVGLGGSNPAPPQAPKDNLFGSPAPFGTSTAFGTSSAFGTQQSSSAFGKQQSPSAFGTQQSSSAFGTPQSSSAFGTLQYSSAFGTQQSSSAFGTQQSSSAFGTQQSSSAFGSQPTASTFGTSSPQGQLFRPPSFSLPTAQSPPQTSGGFGFGTPTPTQTPFGSTFGGTTAKPPSSNAFGTTPTPAATTPAFGSPAQPGAGGFGQPSQLGPGQQALGSALGSFGQTRQMGFGSASPFGSTPSAGFGSAASGGGFAAASGTGGGFASAATGGGFAGAATGGGFAGGASGGGFAAAAGGGGGFGAFGGNSSGGFGGAAQQQSAFGTTSPPAQALFTQMRK